MKVARRDARSLDHATLEEMRRLAVKRVLNGETEGAVATSLEVNRRTVTKWVSWYRKGGEAQLRSRKATGRPPALDERQTKQLREVIVGRNPQQLSFGTALWTIPILQQLIERRWGKVLHPTTVSRTLHRLGLTPQQPSRRAFQRDDEACQKWASEEFPKLVRRTKRKQATMLFVDETGVHEQAPVGTTWAERGRRPVIRVSGSRRKVNVISAISPRGRLWFRCFRGNLTAARFLEFLEALLHDLRGKLILVLDRHPAHTATALRRWVLKNRHRIELHFLPAYAPDMNPDEHVWSHLKGMFRRAPLLEKESLDEAVAEAMELIASDRELLRAFFGHPEVAYVKQAFGW